MKNHLKLFTLMLLVALNTGVATTILAEGITVMHVIAYAILSILSGILYANIIIKLERKG